MNNMIWRSAVTSMVVLGLVGCGTSSSDDDDATAASDVTIENFKVQCWHTADGDTWRFDALLSHTDGPASIQYVDMEIRPAVGGDYLYTSGLSPTYNASACWYTYFSTYQDAINCGGCANYGFYITAGDFQGDTNERIFPSTACTTEDAEPPHDYADATPSPFCP